MHVKSILLAAVASGAIFYGLGSLRTVRMATPPAPKPGMPSGVRAGPARGRGAEIKPELAQAPPPANPPAGQRQAQPLAPPVDESALRYFGQPRRHASLRGGSREAACTLSAVEAADRPQHADPGRRPRARADVEALCRRQAERSPRCHRRAQHQGNRLEPAGGPRPAARPGRGRPAPRSTPPMPGSGNR